jgi:hypothetical protein
MSESFLSVLSHFYSFLFPFLTWSTKCEAATQAHVLNAWSPADGTILGGGESLRWGLYWESGSQGACLWRLSLVPYPFPTLYFLFSMMWASPSGPPCCSNHKWNKLFLILSCLCQAFCHREEKVNTQIIQTWWFGMVWVTLCRLEETNAVLQRIYI